MVLIIMGQMYQDTRLVKSIVDSYPNSAPVHSIVDFYATQTPVLIIVDVIPKEGSFLNIGG